LDILSLLPRRAIPILIPVADHGISSHTAQRTVEPSE